MTIRLGVLAVAAAVPLAAQAPGKPARLEAPAVGLGPFALGGTGEWAGSVALGGRWSLGFGAAGAAVRGEHDWLGREIGTRLGVERSVGRATLSAGALGASLDQPKVSMAGAFLAARLTVGSVQVEGEVGQLARIAGSFAAWSGAGRPVDTLRSGPQSPSHGWLAVRRRFGPVDLAGRVVARTRLASEGSAGWEASAAFRFVDGWAVAVTGGRAPIGTSPYLPYRDRVTIGLALAPRRSRTFGSVERRGWFAAEPDSAGVVFHFWLPGIERVELLGDLTDWRPVAMTALGGGRFDLALAVPPGSYLINLRLDGGKPLVPPGLPAVDDGFGGEAGVISWSR
ncbi:MAG: hypothetical protein R2882_12845 [Gemmatimonadales bacterium]